MDLPQRWHSYVLVALLFGSISFAEVIEKKQPLEDQNKTFENLNTEKSDVKSIIGAIEKIRLVPPNIILKARIDTGAKTTSIDARDITPFERDGKEWVRFVCHTANKKHVVERKIIKTILIKRHGKESQRRYVINMRIVLGNISQLVRVTLNDRENYMYPILIGRNILRDYFIVDVSKKYLFKPIALAK